MTPESVHRANGLEQSLLHEVLRFGLVPAEQASGTEQAVPVRGHQFLHGPRVLTAEPLDQLFLVHAPFVPPAGKGFKDSARISRESERPREPKHLQNNGTRGDTRLPEPLLLTAWDRPSG